MNRSGAPIYEHEIQRIWAEQDFDSSGLKTVDGKKIEVFSPGWWNQGQGPDFEAARLSIGDDFFYGSVEVHLQNGSSTGSIQPKNAFHGATFVDLIVSASQTEQLWIPAGDAPGPC